LAYTNNTVNTLNRIIRENTIDTDEVLCKHDLLTSYTTIVDKFLDAVITNSEDYIVDDLQPYTKDGYGRGYMVRLQAVYGGEKIKPLFILDHKDVESIQCYYNNLYERFAAAKNAPRGHASKYWVQFYQYKEGALCLTPLRSASHEEFAVTKGIDYGFALTVHKSQGSTYNNGFVDVRDIVYDAYGRAYDNIDTVNRLLYVALSRFKNKVFMRY
jgi:exodeoxyribonuclease-5